jgi:two-component system CitB family response regulator
MIRTLIVDDDFRIAGAHGFRRGGVWVHRRRHRAHDGRGEGVRELSPDSVLLDVYRSSMKSSWIFVPPVGGGK